MLTLHIAKKLSNAISKVERKHDLLCFYNYKITVPSIVIPIKKIQMVDIFDTPAEYNPSYNVSFIGADFSNIVIFNYSYDKFNWKLETDKQIHDMFEILSKDKSILI